MSAEFASCWWLQDHIELSYDGTVHACCYGYPKASTSLVADRVGNMVKWEEVGHIYLCDVIDNKFPAETIRLRKQELHAQIAVRDAAADVCLECPVLKSQSWPEKKYLFRLLTLNTWLHCNLKCFYCFVAKPDFVAKRVKYDLHAVIDDMLRGGHLDPAGEVSWGGGDISALPGFNEVCDLFADYGVQQMFKTSGFKFLRGVARVLREKRGTVEVSVDAGTRETYERIKGKDAYEPVVANLIEYAKHGDVVLKYITAKDNLGDRDIDGFLDLVRTLKSKSVMVTPEWTQCHNGEYTDEHRAQIAKLIEGLRPMTTVMPDNDADGARLFPNGMWNELSPYLAAHALQQPA